MREIKFRQPIWLQGKFHHWHYWGFCKKGTFVAPAYSPEQALKESQQHTGSEDKNSKEICEGDIVINDREEKGIIKFINGGFVSEYIPPFDWDIMEKTDGRLDLQTVIGNIYENPELMKDQL